MKKNFFIENVYIQIESFSNCVFLYVANIRFNSIEYFSLPCYFHVMERINLIEGKLLNIETYYEKSSMISTLEITMLSILNNYKFSLLPSLYIFCVYDQLCLTLCNPVH